MAAATAWAGGGLLLHGRSGVRVNACKTRPSDLPLMRCTFGSAAVSQSGGRRRRTFVCAASLKTEEEDRLVKRRGESLGAPDASASKPSENGSKMTEIEKSRPSSPVSEEAGEEKEGMSETALGGILLAVLVVLGIVAGVTGTEFNFKDRLYDAITFFEHYIEGLGPAGYAVFVGGYAVLEMLAIPAIPLTMSAGLLFGVLTGTMLVTLGGTIAATAAFLISRYIARDRILGWLKNNKKFLAIDRAIGADSFRVVALLRLSPLLPFSIGNYVYGLTSVQLAPYMLASFIGMLPGTWAYVSAGSLGRTLLESEGGKGLEGTQLLSLTAGVLLTLGAAAYVTNVAKDAIKDIDD